MYIITSIGGCAKRNAVKTNTDNTYNIKKMTVQQDEMIAIV